MALPAPVMVPIGSIKPNPNNPRVIRDERFQKLVQSITDFPAMLALRPIVVNADGVVLGGNMRLRACQTAKLREVPVVYARDLTTAQQQEFVVKDNISAGAFSWSVFFDQGEHWDVHALIDWGLELPYSPNVDPSFNQNQVTDKDIAATEKQLTGKFKDRDALREVTCPHCAKDFYLDD